MSLYQNAQWGFQIDLPQGWKEPGIFHKLFSGTGPEFFGPHEKVRKKYSTETPDPTNEAALKFVVSPIPLEPTVEKQQSFLEHSAGMHKHNVIDTGTITLLGKIHATIVYEAPRPGFDNILVYRFKKYHLIFNQIEYVVTAKLATLPHSYLQPVMSQEYQEVPLAVKNAPAVTRLQAVYMYAEDYDDILSTFKLL